MTTPTPPKSESAPALSDEQLVAMLRQGPKGRWIWHDAADRLEERAAEREKLLRLLERAQACLDLAADEWISPSDARSLVDDIKAALAADAGEKGGGDGRPSS